MTAFIFRPTITQENTSNLLSSIELPYSNGFTDYVENIGKLEQRGWEVTARVTILRNDRNRLLWSVTGNIAHNEDKIVKLSEALKAANEKLALQYDYTANLSEQDHSRRRFAEYDLCSAFTRY